MPHEMKEFTGAIALLLILAASASSAVELKDAREVRDTYGLTIAMKKHQRVVMFDDRDMATSVLAFVRTPLDAAGPALRTLAKGRYGEQAWEDRERSDLDYWQERYGGVSPERDRRLQALHAAGIRVNRYREMTFRSAEYNTLKLLGWTRGYSELTIRLLDGNAIFSVPSTIIWLQRRDWVYAWGTAFHLPIPSFHRQGAIFVSDDELSLIPALAEATRSVAMPYAELNYSRSLLVSTPILLQAAAWVRGQP